MAGAGKSSIGKKLAKNLKFNFVDSDLLIEKKYGKSLQDILSQEGNEKFKEIEQGALLLVEFSQIVLATGGSAVFCDAAMEYIKGNSMVIYLEVPYEDISAAYQIFLKEVYLRDPIRLFKRLTKSEKDCISILLIILFRTMGQWTLV